MERAHAVDQDADRSKVKVKLCVLFFFSTEHHAMKAYWGAEV
jgi:hypothetical protein